MTGENTPTHGQLLVAGIDVVRNPDKIKRLVGYCPQFDALWDKLTARQHLHLYGAIKGVPEDKMVREVNLILASMGLNDFADKMAGGESLSCACRWGGWLWWNERTHGGIMVR